MYDDWTSNERTIKVATTTTRPPGRGREWTATVGTPAAVDLSGRFNATGKTEPAALAALAAIVQAYMANFREPVVITFRGHVAVVSLIPTSDPTEPVGWHRQITHTDGHMGSSSGGASGWDEALADARRNLAHLTTDWHDDASVREAAAFLAGGERHGWCNGPADLLEYASWQRAARAAQVAGESDVHRWACDHLRDPEFAVPPLAEETPEQPATAEPAATGYRSGWGA